MLPLDDIVVFDLSRVLSGPFCSMYLADFGARVVKLERPGEGDDTRAFGPPFLPDRASSPAEPARSDSPRVPLGSPRGESTYFLSVNRNKESVAIDMKHPEG